MAGQVVAVGRVGWQARQGEIVMVFARAQEDHLVGDAVRHFQAHDLGIEARRDFQVADHQDQVPELAGPDGGAVLVC